MPATIAQLEEVVRQEEISAQYFGDLAGKHPEKYDYYMGLVHVARANVERIELTIKAIKESAIYNQFGKDD